MANELKKYTKREWLEIRQRVYLSRVMILRTISEERDMHAENSERVMAELTQHEPNMQNVITAMALQAGFSFIQFKTEQCIAAIKEDSDEFNESGIIWKTTK